MPSERTMALIQTCQIQAIMTVPHRLFFSAQLSNCNLATCWHIELSILGLLIQHSFEQRLQLFYQVLSFEKKKTWAGLGRILAVLAQTQKTLMFTKANMQQSPLAKTRM